MKKKLIKLTESDLHNVIVGSVKKVLREGFEDGDTSTVEKLTQIRENLAEIMDSGFIPFTSPSPSSTEQMVKDSILKADRLLGDAIRKCKELGY